MMRNGWKFAALCGAGLALCAAGFLTNGMPIVGPTSSGNILGHVNPRWLEPTDTLLPQGAAPQSVATSIFQQNAEGAEVAANTATSTAGAATLNTFAGTITTEALTTAAGSTYTFTLTNSLIAAVSATNPQMLVDMYSKSNTGGTNNALYPNQGAQMSVTSITQSAGSAVIVFTNNGTSALNGTMLIAFHV